MTRITFTGIAVLATTFALTVGHAVGRVQPPDAKPAKTFDAQHVEAIRKRILDVNVNREFSEQELAMPIVIRPKVIESEEQLFKVLLLESASSEIALRLEEFRVGRGTFDVMLEAAKRLNEQQMGLAHSREDRLRSAAHYSTLMQFIYKLMIARREIREQDLNQTQYAYMASCLALLQLQSKPADNPPANPPPAATPLDPAMVKVIRERFAKATGEPKEDPKLPDIVPPKVIDSEEKVLKLLMAECVARELQLRYKEFRVGRGTLDVMLEACRHWRAAQLELLSTREDRVKFSSQYCELMDSMAQLNQKRFDVGAIRQQDNESTRYAWIEAHLWLTQTKK